MTASQPSRGFALVAALWALVVLMFIAAGIVAVGHSAASSSRIHAARQDRMAIVDAGLEVAIYRLLDRDPSRRPTRDGRPFIEAIDGTRVTLEVQDQAGLIDLNATPAALLQRLLVAVGVDPDQAEDVAVAVVDWREGAALDKSVAADDVRSSLGLRRRLFLSVDELQLVPGMSHELFKLLKPALTVVSQSQDVDIAVAPMLVLMAVQSMDAASAAGAVAERGQTTSYPLTPVVGRAFSICGMVTGTDKSAARCATIRLSGDSKTPVWIYRWE